MSDHAERILERILAGELDEHSAEARELFAAEPAARERLDELRAIEAALARERADLCDARGGRAAPNEDAIVRGFAALAVSQSGAASAPNDAQPTGAARRPAGGTPGRRFRAPWLFALAAGLLALVWFGWRAYEPGDDPSIPTTLGDRVELSPAGTASDYRTFAWNIDPPTNGFFELSIVSDDGTRLVHEPELTGRRFALDAARADALPKRIRWKLVEHGADGAPTGRVFETQAWR